MSLGTDMMDEDEGGGNDGKGWLATFSDMATLLLTFFVLLLSFAEVEAEEFQELVAGMVGALGQSREDLAGMSDKSSSPISISDIQKTPELELVEDEKLLDQVQRLIRAKGLQDFVDASVTDRGVVLRVKDMVLFPPGSATLADNAAGALEAVVQVATAIPAPIVVEGHTDNVPIKTAQFPSNWELSAARAVSSMRYIMKSGRVSFDRLSVAGFADTQPRQSNEDAEGRKNNRRVEFIFLKPQDRWKADLRLLSDEGGPVVEIIGISQAEIDAAMEAKRQRAASAQPPSSGPDAQPEKAPDVDTNK